MDKDYTNAFALKFSVDFEKHIQKLLMVLATKGNFMCNCAFVYKMVVKAEECKEYAEDLAKWFNGKTSTLELRDDLVSPLCDIKDMDNYNIFLSLDSAYLELKNI